MAEYFRGRRARLRPHFKTHKSPAIAHRQVAAGAKGICCAKLSEAEVLLAAGITDVLIANQVIEPSKIARLAGLARGGAKVTVCADNPQNVAELSRAASRIGAVLRVLVEVDVGMNRCGVRTPTRRSPLHRPLRDHRGSSSRASRPTRGTSCSSSTARPVARAFAPWRNGSDGSRR